MPTVASLKRIKSILGNIQVAGVKADQGECWMKRCLVVRKPTTIFAFISKMDYLWRKKIRYFGRKTILTFPNI